MRRWLMLAALLLVPVAGQAQTIEYYGLDAIGSVRVVFDANGNVLTQTDRGGRVTRMVYDEANRLVETIAPDDDANPANNPRTTSDYDAAVRRLAGQFEENFARFAPFVGPVVQAAAIRAAA